MWSRLTASSLISMNSPQISLSLNLNYAGRPAGGGEVVLGSVLSVDIVEVMALPSVRSLATDDIE